MTETRRDRWERWAEWPLTLVALLFLAAYALAILSPDLGSPWSVACRVVTWGAWGIFAVDYVVRLTLSRDRPAFMRGNVFDWWSVGLPILRPLRSLRLVTLLTVLNRYAGGSLRGRVAVYAGGRPFALRRCVGRPGQRARRRGANIETFGDALWWAMTTVTTVGYGDHFPVTETGRFVAGGLMLAGIALLGVVTASLASWRIEGVAEVEEQSQSATRRDVNALAAEVSALRAQVSRLAR